MNSCRFKWSLVGIAIGAVYYWFAMSGSIDGFESLYNGLNAWDGVELDELLLAMVAVLVFFLMDCLNLLKAREYDRKRLEVYQATLESTNHIINNFLNQAQILELAVEDDPKIDPEIIQMYRNTIDEAKEQLERLDRLELIEPDRIRKTVYPEKVEPSLSAGVL